MSNQISLLTGIQVENIYLIYLVFGVVAFLVLKKVFEKMFFIVLIGFIGFILYDIFKTTDLLGVLIFIGIAVLITIPLTILNPLGVSSDFDDEKKNKKR